MTAAASLRKRQYALDAAIVTCNFTFINPVKRFRLLAKAPQQAWSPSTPKRYGARPGSVSGPNPRPRSCLAASPPPRRPDRLRPHPARNQRGHDSRPLPQVQRSRHPRRALPSVSALQRNGLRVAPRRARPRAANFLERRAAGEGVNQLTGRRSAPEASRLLFSSLWPPSVQGFQRQRRPSNWTAPLPS